MIEILMTDVHMPLFAYIILMLIPAFCLRTTSKMINVNRQLIKELIELQELIGILLNKNS